MPTVGPGSMKPRPAVFIDGKLKQRVIQVLVFSRILCLGVRAAAWGLRPRLGSGRVRGCFHRGRRPWPALLIEARIRPLHKSGQGFSSSALGAHNSTLIPDLAVTLGEQYKEGAWVLCQCFLIFVAGEHCVVFPSVMPSAARVEGRERFSFSLVL